MASLTDRRQARERLRKIFAEQLDKLIPPDDSVPLDGAKFIDFEKQADQLEASLCTAFLEERVALSTAARAEEGGRCPGCGSDRVYMQKPVSKVEVLTPHGTVVMDKQRCRCRQCGRSFSPSEP